MITPMPETFDTGRADLCRAVVRRIDRERIRSRHYRASTGRSWSYYDLTAMRDGDPDRRVGLSRLLCLAEWLGVTVHCVAVPGEIPAHVRQAQADATPRRRGGRRRPGTA